MREIGFHSGTGPGRRPTAAAVVALVATALLAAGVVFVALGAPVGGAAGAADTDPVAVENGSTYTVGQPLSFAVDSDRNGDGFQVRENDSFVAVYEAVDGEVVIEDTEALGPGEYTLEHGNTAEVVYTFTLEPAPETPSDTPTPDPEDDVDERYEHRIIWPHEIPRDQRRNAETTTGGLHWIGDMLRIEVGDDAFVEVRDDGEVLRTLVNDGDETYLPTSDMPPGTYTVAHEDGDWSFRLGLQVQRFAVTVDEDARVVDIDSSRPAYRVTLSSDTVSNATLADAFANATAIEDDRGRTVAVVEGAGRSTKLPYDADGLPEGTHNLTVAVPDAPVSATVAVTGTGTVESTPEPPTTETDPEPETDEEPAGTDDETDDETATTEAAAASPATPGEDDLSAPGFGPVAALVGVLAAALLARRR